MDYEFGTGQQGLNYPNPYRIENLVLSIRAGIFLIATLTFIVLAKLDLDSENWKGLGINLLAIIGFMYGTIVTGSKISKQLRVYFGRGQPKGLAPDLNSDQVGTTKQADHLKETIRQGALVVNTPPGNVNGLLYSYLKSLIIAPYEIQAWTQHVFSNIIKMSVITGLFLLALFFAINSNAKGWIGLYFFGVTLVLILRPLFRHSETVVTLNFQTFWILFASALLIPIALIAFGKSFPDISNWSFGWQSFLILVITIAGEALALLALKGQLITPTGLTTSFEQDAVSFNAQPSQMNQEIERRLQSEWVAQIPNRIYSRIAPDNLTQESGNFKGQIIQETQPIAPASLSRQQTLESIKASPRLQKVLIMDIIALVFTLVPTIGIIFMLTSFHRDPIANYSSLYWLPSFVGMLCLSSYWIKISHALWGRFDFESKLYVIEYEGSYSMAKMNFGNQLKDTLQTNKKVINVESMTLRVWITHLNTVVFGHGINSEQRHRTIINMVGLKNESKAFLSHVKEFIQGQSMLLNPNAGEDLKRVTALSQLNAIGNTVGQESTLRIEEAAKAAILLNDKPEDPKSF